MINKTLTEPDPFYLILYSPQKAFKKIFNDANHSVVILIIIGCLWQTITSIARSDSNAHVWSSLITSALIAIFIGWALFYFYAAILSWCARLLGGTGTVRSTYTILAWSFLPGLIVILSYAVALAVWGDSIMKGGSADDLSAVRMVLKIVNGLMGLWFLYILVNGIMFTHKLNVLKAILSLLLPVSTIYILIYSLILLT